MTGKRFKASDNVNASNGFVCTHRSTGYRAGLVPADRVAGLRGVETIPVPADSIIN